LTISPLKTKIQQRKQKTNSKQFIKVFFKGTKSKTY